MNKTNEKEWVLEYRCGCQCENCTQYIFNIQNAIDYDEEMKDPRIIKYRTIFAGRSQNEWVDARFPK